jgi:hypothetical protein
MGVAFDQRLADKILEVSADIDRMVATVRSIKAPWSFLADQQYDVFDVWISSFPAVTDGFFYLRVGSDLTGAISYNSDADSVRGALETVVGVGNVAVVGPAGGPWSVTYAGSLTGPQPVVTSETHLEPEAAAVTIFRRVSSVSQVPSKRYFTADATNWKLLFIDDCVSVSSVAIYGASGDYPSVLSEGIDFVTWPYNASPVEGLMSLSDNWPDFPYRVEVDGVWGYATSVPHDVQEAAIIEVIRSYLADQAGNDDRLGMTPYGTVVTTKAYTSKVWQLVKDYGHAGGFVR